MHIPDGYLGPETIAAAWVVTTPVWYLASRKTKDILSQPKSVPVLAASAAASFLIMMLNVPVVGGTTAHGVGATMIAVIAGPWVAVLSVSAALVIQALFFGDGGILSLGINCLNMAIVMPLVGYGIYRLMAGRSELRSGRRMIGSGIGAYCGIVAAAFLASIELGIQPLLHSAHGVAQYFPYGLHVTIPAMVGAHALIVGPIEAAFTMAVFAFVTRTRPELLRSSDFQRVRARWLVGGIAVLVAAVPLGLLAGGSAWGEWGAAEIKQRVGYVPHGLQLLGGHWQGLLPGYGWASAHGGWAYVAYIVSALVGVAVLSLATWAILALRRRRRRSRTPQAGPATP